MALAMNVGRPPFDDRDVRRAVFQSLEPWAYLEGTLTDEEMVGAGVPVVEESWLLDREAMQTFFDGEPSVNVQGKAVELVVADFGNEQVALGKKIESALREAGFVSTVTVLNPVDYKEAGMGQAGLSDVPGADASRFRPQRFSFPCSA